MIARHVAFAVLTTAAISGAAYAQTAPSTAPKADSNITTITTPAVQKLDMKGAWRTSKLMGLDVYNQANEKLGDINEIILDNTGKVAAVVIGVGGFLGIGEHDIAVTMDKLKFVEEAVRTSATTTTNRTTGAAPASTTTTTTTTANDWAPDHAVMNATKDQLKAMAQFKYSDYN